MGIDNLRAVIDLATILALGLIWIGLMTFLRLRQKKSLTYLGFLTVFYVYLCVVLDYTQLQFQTLLLMDFFMPGRLILQGEAAQESMNLIPLITLARGDIRTSLLNILLLIPFGFLLPFITSLRMKNTVVVGALFSVGIELLQLISGLIARTTFRIVDINDVIFNTLGVAIGYVLFVAFVRIYRRTSHDWALSTSPFSRYIAERPQIDS